MWELFTVIEIGHLRFLKVKQRCKPVKKTWSEIGRGRKEERDFAGSSGECVFRVMCNGIQTAN